MRIPADAVHLYNFASWDDALSEAARFARDARFHVYVRSVVLGGRRRWEIWF